MNYRCIYKTPDNFSNMVMSSDGTYLTGLWFEGSRDSSKHNYEFEDKDLEIFRETRKWLDIYFSGKEPNFTPKYKINNLTPFRKEVIDIMNSIWYGRVITYDDIARIIAQKRKIKKMSAQAVGGAVGWNPICIIIPCHRVTGKNGSLTGYGGGMNNKIQLLKLEKIDISKYSTLKERNSFMNRCKWCNLENPKYVDYHDNEWCKPNFDDKYLFEMLILESFQAGLSWECILNKREDFRKAFDNFDIDKICNYDDKKINELLNNEKIVRNKLKINAAINNSKIFKEIQNEYGTFHNYLKIFTNDEVIYEIDKIVNELSDKISNDLKKRKMKFVGSTIIYSYLQAIGVIYSHDKDCFLYKNN